MKKYRVLIQDKDVGSITAKNTGIALALVGKKIQDGEYFVDPKVEKKIKLEPINTLETASNTVDTTPPQMPDGFYAELIREEP
jgi:hypothetical protein